MIGIYGGTFDPIHFGHLRTALEVQETFSLTQVRLIPCAQSPHKMTHTTPQKRMAMLMLAIQNQKILRVDRREIERSGYSYTIDTLKSTRAEIADMPLLLFMGTDAFATITAWRQWQRLFDYAHIVVMTRPYYQPQPLIEFLNLKLTQTKHDLSNKPAGCLFFQPVTALDISATYIRKLVAMGMSPRFLLPDAVIDYIQQHKLYVKIN